MWEASERIDIAAHPSQVWEIVADFEAHPALAGSGEVLAVRMLDPVGLGARFEGDVKTGEVGSFTSTNQIDVFEPATELAWTSYPPLAAEETEDHQIEVHWTFRLSHTTDGTAVEHAFAVVPPRAGAAEFAQFIERTDRVATVRAGMLRTLQNLRSRAEAPRTQ